MRTIVLALLVTSCQTETAAEPKKDAAPFETVDGFPLPLPAGAEIQEVRSATTPRVPRAELDAELDARVPGDVDEIAAFFIDQLETRGFTLERSEHERVDKEPEVLEHPKLKRTRGKLVRLVGKKGVTQVHVIITHGRDTHRVQIAVAGPL